MKIKTEEFNTKKFKKEKEMRKRQNWLAEFRRDFDEQFPIDEEADKIVDQLVNKATKDWKIRKLT